MPDFERLIDDLHEHCAKTTEEHAFLKGYKKGKTRARIEIVFAVIALIILIQPLVFIGAKSI